MASLSAVPFSRGEFLELFRAYNEAVWPGQLILYVVGVVCLILVYYDRNWARRAIMALLGGFWLWMAIAYHALYFARIHPGAWGFGALFVGEAALFGAAALGDQPQEPKQPLSRSLGALLVLYAMVVYPILGAISDHAYPYASTFGLPGPTTIFTFGILLLTSQTVSWWLFAIPTLWALVGSSAPIAFGIWEDVGLLVAAVVSVAARMARSRREASKVVVAT